MRMVPPYEKRKRGCQYCLHAKRVRDFGEFRSGCQYNECPYTVLDKYESYEAFMESEDSKILVAEFFIGCGEWCSVSKSRKSPAREFSDGDGKVGL